MYFFKANRTISLACYVVLWSHLIRPGSPRIIALLTQSQLLRDPDYSCKIPSALSCSVNQIQITGFPTFKERRLYKGVDTRGLGFMAGGFGGIITSVVPTTLSKYQFLYLQNGKNTTHLAMLREWNENNKHNTINSPLGRTADAFHVLGGQAIEWPHLL